MALFRLNIEWADNSNDTLVYKYPFKKSGREVNDKSTLTVRESQCAVFVYKGQVDSVFTPGFYELKTHTFPLISKLCNWTYAFQNPIICEVYFINTKQFTDIKWGTKNPIIMRDADFGNIRVRGFGAFSFKVNDATIFLKELFGSNSSFKTSDIADYLKTLLISSLTDVLGESKISVLDLAGNTEEFNKIIKERVEEKFNSIGLTLANLVIENMSVPEEIEKALDERTKLGILGDKTDVLMKIAATEAMKSAAKNEGNGFVGAGIGLGAGASIGQMFMGAMNNSGVSSNTNSKQDANNQSQKECPKCLIKVDSQAKFCSNCGYKFEESKFCTNCGVKVDSNAKFCANCGNKL